MGKSKEGLGKAFELNDRDVERIIAESNLGEKMYPCPSKYDLSVFVETFSRLCTAEGANAMLHSCVGRVLNEAEMKDWPQRNVHVLKWLRKLIN